ncbi:Hypothetical predicted protein [Cloeon dipterum]|uniref:Uncharacterized protein n=1 Tax=Cloeon dipterum TaxID=197152 RepID=A0A8S1CR50_9INSE|nr:Hypothetical predicted protein [Cloeon dipterum]
MDGLKKFSSDSITSSKSKVRDTAYPDYEPDNVRREGDVFIVRRGVGNKSDEETVLHHWAIAVKFDNGKWVTIEGINEDALLSPGYCYSSSEPDGTIIDIEDSPAADLEDDHLLKYMATITQFIKSISLEIVRRIEASPRDLHKLAGSIPIKPYCLGVNDCQTWFLDALRKLQFFEIGTKSMGDCALDTLRAPLKTLTNAGFKAASTVTNTGLEALNTVGRFFSGKENPATALVDGAGKTTNHVITGVADTAAGAVDGVAGFAVNVIGLVTGGGCATKNGMSADIGSLVEEVDSGRMSTAEAFVQVVGKATGNVVYGVANTTTNVIGGVADTATGLVSGVAGTVAAPFKAVDSLAEDIARGEINPVLGVVAAPVVVVGAVAEGVGKTVVNVGVGIINTLEGIGKGLASIF